MNNEQSSSVLVRFLSVAFFSILTLSALVWFFVSINGFLSRFYKNDSVVEFDKGSMYMLGIGFGLLLLTVGGVKQGLFGKKLTSREEIFFTRSLIISFVLMVTVPQLTHYLVENYTEKKHYSICSGATYRWFFYSKFYYTKNEMACNDLINEKERTKRSGEH